MGDKCYVKDCDQTDRLTFVDATCGPLCDYRYYCERHLPEYRVKAELERRERDFVYLQSVVEQKKGQLEKAQQELAEAKRRLQEGE